MVLRVEFEVEPGTPIGDDPRGEEQLAGTVGLAPVMLEEHARTTVQLGDDDTLGAVDDEGSGSRHERDFAHVDFLLLDLFDLLGHRFPVEDHQANPCTQGAREG